ncbi:FAD-dependent oxidoreductase [Burkholderia sp. WAC0059]|uniref:NAD(P)/FAD-dependent oxidoreductase n=1 Tax=Burkholderia sp. WAC0059 TaxID=2066022 RepID=UPI000C7F194C|nr:FAD-dependent oxidoreductase [Burkholderia sp. WAC0059]PLZ01938.1 FAD-dependent oxidoreductase [Burkholderia sp. WAC0059]
MNPADVIVIGGGLVGSAIAWGLNRSGRQVTLLDGADQAFRAARGNFGLVWVQSKGAGLSPYATWTRSSATRWPLLARELLEETGIDVQLRQPGGFHLCFSDEEMTRRAAILQTLRDELDGDYPFEMLDHADVKAKLPALGPEVVGASYTAMDGHVNPLKLLRALHTACRLRGVTLATGQQVERVEPTGNGFIVRTTTDTFRAERVVFAAGLANRALAEPLGLNVPVGPNRGEVMIGERVGHFLDYPTTYIRQTDEGTIQIGDSHEDVGFDDGVKTDVLATIAQRGIRSFPVLAQMKLVRVWGALRVMSADGFPIYQESPQHPGAFVATCHSGVTLAAAHALRLAPWIAGAEPPAGIEPFTGERFRAGSPVPQSAH